MKKKLLLFLSMLSVTFSALAWNNGDSFVVGGVTYNITNDASKFVNVIGANTSAIIGGTITIPKKVADPNDPNIFYTIRDMAVGGGTGQTFPSTPSFTRLVVEADINTFRFCNNSSPVTVSLPYSCNYVDVHWASRATIVNFEFPNGSSTFAYDAVKGDLLSKDGKTLYLHLTSKDPADGKYTIPAGVTTVYQGSLTSNITELTIPSSVTTIAVADDWNTIGSKVETIKVESGNTKYEVVDGVLYEKLSDGKRALLKYPTAKTDVTSFTIPDDVTVIRKYALVNPTLTSLDLNNVTTIENWAMSLTSLTSITIPANMTTIGSGVFASCTALTSINVAEGNTSFKSVDGVMFSADGKRLLNFPISRSGEYTLPEGVTTIESLAFRQTRLTKFIAGPDLLNIAYNAFWQSGYIREADLSPANGALINNGGFTDCWNFNKVTLSKNMTEIRGFDHTGLTTLIIPENSEITTVQSNALANTYIPTIDLSGCTKLTSVQANAFQNARATSIILPSSLVSIGDRAFSGSKIESINIPQNVTNIRTEAFANTPNLKTVTFESGSKLTTIGSAAFVNCGIESIVIPDGVTTIEREAFQNCDVFESVTLPASLENISPEAFKFCYNLKEINVDENNPKYASVDGILMSKDLKTVILFPAGKVNMSTLLPPTVEKIGDYAFYANNQLTNITLPAKVTEIGERAFGLCSNLTSLTFLGSSMMDPSGISQGANVNAFDNGAADNITLNVRAAVKTAYESDSFYSTFDGVTPSSKVGHEEYIAMSETAAMLLSTDATDKVYKVPSTIAGLTVANIGDNAFDNVSSSVYEVIVPATVTDLGFQAFKNSSVTNIYFLGDAVKAATEKYGYPNTDNEFNANQNIYVRRSQLTAAKANMARFANQITNEVPYAAPTADFGTFSREFATDFSQGGTNTTSNPQFIAFNTIVRKEIKGDTDVFIIESINAGGADGTYIPANTGVIFKKYGTAPTYYEIADNQTASPVATFVVPVLEETTVTQGAGSVQHYYIGKSDGKAHLITSAITIGAHKAYLKVTASSPAKKVAFRFIGDSDDSATGINEVEAASEKSEAIYNLNGQRVSGSTRGILIRGGKKYINQ